MGLTLARFQRDLLPLPKYCKKILSESRQSCERAMAALLSVAAPMRTGWQYFQRRTHKHLDSAHQDKMITRAMTSSPRREASELARWRRVATTASHS
jgi:hypothetical protein